MTQGQIFLAIFDAESESLLAITESIDNNAGGALKDWSPTPEPAAEAATGCGPYVGGAVDSRERRCLRAWLAGQG